MPKFKNKPSPLKGFTKETHAGIMRAALSKIGRKRPDIAKEKNPNWKGGATSEAMLIRNSGEYDRWRKAVFERDNFTCQNCGQRSGKLNAHHLRPFAIEKERRLDVANGITLCINCHSARHPDNPTLLSKAKATKHRRSLSDAARARWSKPEERRKQSERKKAGMTNELRQKISEAKKGTPSWNKGLTKENPSVARMAKKNSDRMLGKGGRLSNVWKRWHPDE